ncbi:TRAP transporter substrate-binding protein [Paracoccus sp. 1_MG-2023]|uniref:TRAP transporter substrate-binding protein n=1 Tax=unclassified Paracoccus (in: a-proteobacteria) TaxID=2688777 RepID=UPI001C09ED93|nr:MULTISPECIES: TRAP transporter substrate-binding protein [unclassified Paracoccus (in: a-proteobacteria)]MBU2957713.1 TRAP transporter substrate-binding protein [Paracoccus sp. C2R09]MDO6667439.1 TRAP transporter substrate-binding protein [Paracoccus sp. 1_MG-2023]
MKRILLGTAIAALATSAAHAETWQMSADAPDGNYLTQNIRAFAEDVARLTEGELEIEVVSNSVLLKRPELKRGVQRGIVPIGEVLISALGNEDAAYSADAVPLLATTFDEAKALWDASRPIYEEKLDEEGLVLLYAAPWPPQGIYMNGEVTDASSFDGVKFRAYNPSTARLAELLGAVPATIATAEISQAFSTGVIDGMITSPSTGVDSQAWDFVSHYYDVQAFIPKNMVIVNKGSFDGLNEGVQDALREAADLAETRGWDMAETATTEATQTMADNGMQVLPTPDGLAADFEEIAATMRAEWLEQAGEDGQTITDALN